MKTGISTVLVAICCSVVPKIYGEPLQAPPQIRTHPLSYALGDVPPKLDVRRWTDGRTHSLVEFRGQVVVMEFTGMWCGVCRKSAPVMRRLVEHYKDQRIVFFGIHTPTDDDEGVAKMMKEDGFPQLMAIDERVDPIDKLSMDGKTAKSYGTIQWPTLVVLDQLGSVSFSGEILDRTMTREQVEPIYVRCAAKADIAYPMPKELSDSASNEWIQRLSFEFHREWIDKAIHSKP